MKIYTWTHQIELSKNEWEGHYSKLSEFLKGIIMTGTPDQLHYHNNIINNRFDIHLWFWTMVCLDEQVISEHPDWYNVNKLGESSATSPPYVGYYKWLCPNNPNVPPFLIKRLKPYLELDFIKGVSLDYIRYPDVILPEALQPRYNLIQDRELPKFDFCYCPNCLKKFKEQTGLEARRLKSDKEHDQWAKFRERSITSIVNELAKHVKSYDKEISASVFPSPSIAKRLVRQNWAEWNLDRVLPMNYHNFYNKGIDWIEEVVKEGKESIPKDVEYMSALYLPALNIEGLKKAINSSLTGGSDGIALFNFSSISDDYVETLKTYA